MTAIEMEKILHAYNEGKEIQYLSITKKWCKVNYVTDLLCNGLKYTFRIKP